ncbi:uncharacterized protein BCR38DRAFT_486010 [Pseudomassariella vexata]|uniref:AP complex mu/sigma subunit domain-containing protein n=1 Tax=Pseudomassariella vexata TaxID=1141098 RepID=A0A1Y2DVP2_9PEZI|nr:uncharacterized protein BCR38DRAFT_486010 [Pseudomassariella vexata]ORY63259.1 hypothetical protein BCR38DRAFT_486010 [Pseudomassariella vexata]
MLSFILIQNRQGKTRLAKWYVPYSDNEKIKLKGEYPTIARAFYNKAPVISQFLAEEIFRQLQGAEEEDIRLRLSDPQLRQRQAKSSRQYTPNIWRRVRTRPISKQTRQLARYNRTVRLTIRISPLKNEGGVEVEEDVAGNENFVTFEEILAANDPPPTLYQ